MRRFLYQAKLLRHQPLRLCPRRPEHRLFLFPGRHQQHLKSRLMTLMPDSLNISRWNNRRHRIKPLYPSGGLSAPKYSPLR